MAPLTCYRGLLHASGAAARQLVDADDRLAGHGRVDAAGAVAAAGAGLARPVLGAWRRCWCWRMALIGWLRAARCAARSRAARAARRATAPIVRHPPFVRHGAAGLLHLRRADRRAVAVGRPVADAGGGLVGRRRPRRGCSSINLGMLFAFLRLGRADAAAGQRRASAPAADRAGACRRACCCWPLIVALRAGRRRRALGAVVRAVHLRVAQPAGGGRRLSRPRWPAARCRPSTW